MADLVVTSLLGPFEELVDILGARHVISSFFFSYYFIIGFTCLFITNRLTSIIRPPTTGMLWSGRFMCRLPIIYIAISFAQIVPIELGSIQSVLFFGFYCLEYIVSLLFIMLETRTNVLITEPPTILEWGASLYFNAQVPQIQSSFSGLISIHLFQIVFYNILGMFGLLHSKKLFASLIMTMIQISHCVYQLWHSKPYPTLLYLERIPELLIIVIVGLFSIVYVLGSMIHGKWLEKPLFMKVEINPKQESRALFRSLAETIATAPKNQSFSKELEPIIAPIGIGMVPRLLLKKQRLLDTIVHDEATLQSNSFDSSLESLKLWYWIVYAPFSYLNYYISSNVSSCPTFDSDSESDSDYIPPSEDESFSVSDDDISDTNTPDETIYKEIFDLTQEMYSQDPLQYYQTTHHNNSFKTDVRACVVCQTEQRNIVIRPCGCLCLCDACREQLAQRQTETCPCCRRQVQGITSLYRLSKSILSMID